MITLKNITLVFATIILGLSTLAQANSNCPDLSGNYWIDKEQTKSIKITLNNKHEYGFEWDDILTKETSLIHDIIKKSFQADNSKSAATLLNKSHTNYFKAFCNNKKLFTKVYIKDYDDVRRFSYNNALDDGIIGVLMKSELLVRKSMASVNIFSNGKTVFHIYSSWILNENNDIELYAKYKAIHGAFFSPDRDSINKELRLTLKRK